MSTRAQSALHAPARPKDTLGCMSSKLSKDIEVETGDIRFYRKRMDHDTLDRVAMPACERGFLIGISLGDGHRRRIFSGRHTVSRAFEKNSIYIRDFSDDYRADLDGQFDFLLVELSRGFFSRLQDEHDGRAFSGLLGAGDDKDPELGRFAHALSSRLETDGALNALYIEQMGAMMGSHIARRYGNFGAAAEPRKGVLSIADTARAKELLMQHSAQRASIADVASECNLSRGYFIRAFSKTTGRTPHQWLLEQRVAQARKLIEATGMALSEIAVSCGFADQSHLSRVFLKVVGTSPGAWRRAAGR